MVAWAIKHGGRLPLLSRSGAYYADDRDRHHGDPDEVDC